MYAQNKSENAIKVELKKVIIKKVAHRTLKKKE